MGFLGGIVVKNLPANAGDSGSVPGVGKIIWRRKWQSTLVLLPGKFHGQRNLAHRAVWGRKELDVTEHTHKHNWFTMLISGISKIRNKQWFTYIHTRIHTHFQILFPFSLLQDIEYSFLCYILYIIYVLYTITINNWLSILYILLCIC